MSFGALSANAILALNEGAKPRPLLSRHRRGLDLAAITACSGGDLVWEIGSGYFGCRDANGRFDEKTFVENAASDQVKMIEMKLSQGAKPGHGGVLPGAKVTPEIAAGARRAGRRGLHFAGAAFGVFHAARAARIRRAAARALGRQAGRHQARDRPSVGMVRHREGDARDRQARRTSSSSTAARAAPARRRSNSPTTSARRCARGSMLVHNSLVGTNLRDKIRVGASGKIVTAFDIARTMAIGADWCNSARGFMFALGCIQAQTCHTGNCPTGVTTQDPVRMRALVVPDKSERVFNFHLNTLKALKELLAAAGLNHPSRTRARARRSAASRPTRCVRSRRCTTGSSRASCSRAFRAIPSTRCSGNRRGPTPSPRLPTSSACSRPSPASELPGAIPGA